MYVDIHGNSLSAANAVDAQSLDSIVLGLAGMRLDAAGIADGLGDTMPNVPMAHILRASCYLMAAEGAALPELRRSLSAATALRHLATERELMHMRALSRWADGDFVGAAIAYSDLTAAYPRDLHGLQVGQQADFFTGRQTELRDRIARALPYWSIDMAGHGYLLGMLAFGLEENGSFEAAEDAGRRAVALNPADGWAVHAVAHCLEMEGRTDAGIYWLGNSSDRWAPGSILAYHNWWHLALFHTENRNWEAVLELYDAHNACEPGAPALELVDASALLWRLWLAGADIGDRAIPIADAWEATLTPIPEQGHTGPGYYMFNDFHAAFARVMAGRMQAAESHIAGLEARVAAGGCHAGVVSKVGLPLVRAIYALGAGDPHGALDLLERHRACAMRAGGSNAQRDVFALTLMSAAEQAGNPRAMHAAATARLAVKPQSAFAADALKRAAALAAA